MLWQLILLPNAVCSSLYLMNKRTPSNRFLNGLPVAPAWKNLVFFYKTPFKRLNLRSNTQHINDLTQTWALTDTLTNVLEQEVGERGGDNVTILGHELDLGLRAVVDDKRRQRSVPVVTHELKLSQVIVIRSTPTDIRNAHSVNTFAAA